MALLTCPECDWKVSEYATCCPKCGCPIDIIKRGNINQDIKYYVNDQEQVVIEEEPIKGKYDKRNCVLYKEYNGNESFEQIYGSSLEAINPTSSTKDIYLPEDIEIIRFDCFNISLLSARVYIGPKVKMIKSQNDWKYIGFNLTRSNIYFIVDENNKYFKSIDGSLYSKDGYIIYNYCAMDKNLNFNCLNANLPSTVINLASYSFTMAKYNNGTQQLSFKLPDKIKYIGAYVFHNINIKVEELHLPKCLEYLGYNALGDLDYLYLYLPKSLKEVDEPKLARVNNFANICYEGTLNDLTNIKNYESLFSSYKRQSGREYFLDSKPIASIKASNGELRIHLYNENYPLGSRYSGSPSRFTKID